MLLKQRFSHSLFKMYSENILLPLKAKRQPFIPGILCIFLFICIVN